MAYLERGLLTGAVGGAAYGLFIGTVGTAATAGLETFEAGHDHGAEPLVPDLVAAVTGVFGGVLWGLLLGVVVFGAGYYLFEPALPDGVRGRITLAGAGFLVVSGAPWLLVPPQPPGVEQSLSTDSRLLLYGGAMALGAVVVGLSGITARVTADRHRAVRAVATVAPLTLIAAAVALAPTNTVSGPAPPTLAVGYQFVVVLGQAGLWATMAVVHAYLPKSPPATKDFDAPPAD